MAKTFQNFKDLFKEWCEVTTCAGIVDLHLARTLYGKIFWSFILIVSFSLTIWQTALLLRQFSNDNPFQTTLTVSPTDSILFPNVTLCNVNRINRSLLGEYENDTDMLSYALMPSGGNYFRSRIYSEEEAAVLEERWVKFKEYSKLSDLRNLFQRLGFTCEDIFLECTFNNKVIDCCKYASEVITAYGRCWTIRPPGVEGNLAEQGMAGISGGLQLALWPNVKQYVRNLVFNNFLEVGFFINIDYVQQSFLNNFNTIQPGAHSWIAMKATKHTIKYSDFPIFKPKCRSLQNFSYLTAEYSPSNCEEECWVQIEHDTCNCTSLTITFPHILTCTSQQTLNCLFPLHDTTLFEEKFRNCRKACFPLCDPYWTIEASQTSTKFVGDHVSQKLGALLFHVPENETSAIDRISMAICLNVFFETLHYTEVQLEETNPIFDFIGNIGGQLSLWLGISLVSIIQGWYYLFACCFSQRVEKRKVDKVNQITKENK